MGSDREDVLDYISKLYETLNRTAGLINKAGLALVILSIAFLVVSVGLVSAKGDYSLAGLELEISLSVLLASGPIMITSLVVLISSATLRGNQISLEIRRLYKSINFDPGRGSI